MIRSFVYGFIIGFTLNLFGVLVFMPEFTVEMEYSYTEEKKAVAQKIIGLCIGFLCSCIAIGWLVYCFKFK